LLRLPRVVSQSNVLIGVFTGKYRRRKLEAVLGYQMGVGAVQDLVLEPDYIFYCGGW